MANSEHLALIKQGVEVWNSWYKKNRRVVPDLAQANLSSLNLSGINLKNANLAQANLSQVNLSRSELINANLSKANLLGANLNDANFKGADLDFVIFAQAILNRHTTMAIKYLKVYEIVNNKLDKKDFSDLDLSNSNFFRADLSKAELSNTKLINANLSRANLSDAYLYKADLTGANLEHADLRNAYFSQANLTSAYLSEALCCGTYFKDANLKFANLKTARFSHKTMIDPKWHSVWEIVNCGAAKKNLSGVDLSDANLQGVNFESANLTNAKLNHAILRRSNLTNANLTNTDLVGANICGVDLQVANLKGTKLKSVISDRHTQLATSNTSLMVKERPVAKTTAKMSPTPIKTPTAQAKSSKNLVAVSLLTFFTILASVITAGYIFINQNPDSPLSIKIDLWLQVENLLPSSR